METRIIKYNTKYENQIYMPTVNGQPIEKLASKSPKLALHTARAQAEALAKQYIQRGLRVRVEYELLQGLLPAAASLSMARNHQLGAV